MYASLHFITVSCKCMCLSFYCCHRASSHEYFFSVVVVAVAAAPAAVAIVFVLDLGAYFCSVSSFVVQYCLMYANDPCSNRNTIHSHVFRMKL